MTPSGPTSPCSYLRYSSVGWQRSPPHHLLPLFFVFFWRYELSIVCSGYVQLLRLESTELASQEVPQFESSSQGGGGGSVSFSLEQKFCQKNTFAITLQRIQFLHCSLLLNDHWFQKFDLQTKYEYKFSYLLRPCLTNFVQFQSAFAK